MIRKVLENRSKEICIKEIRIRRELSVRNKAELLQEGIFFPRPFICRRRFSNEKVGN
jgi:hypothetical protein